MLFPWNTEALNPPFGDPGFLVANSYTGRALIFDLGDLHQLAARKLLQASHIFISHAHIDHLVGFDQLLRLTLNRPRHLHIYGPPGIIAIIGHKLQGYVWNLTAHYELVITAYAVHPKKLEQCSFACSDKFKPGPTTTTVKNGPVIFSDPDFSINAATLDHGTSCLAFTLHETRQVNFRPEVLKQLQLAPGPWLTKLRQFLQSPKPETAAIIRIPGRNRDYTVKEIAAEIALIKPGNKIAYVTDIGFTPENLEKLIPLISGADLLLCEAAFLDSAADKARSSRHLTASQAGEIARRAGVKRLKLFHFSPRHHDLEPDFYREAAQYFSGPIS